MAKHFWGMSALLGISLLAGCAAPLGTVASGDETLNALSQPIAQLSPSLPKATGKRQSTFFAYVAMDDHLTSYAEKFLGAVQDSTSDRVYNVAFADFQGADNSYLFYMQPGKQGFANAFRSFMTPKLKEVTANDPKHLASTVNWAYSNYPSDFKALDIFAHGGGMVGFGTDENQVNGDKRFIMSVGDIGNALRTGLKGRKVDVVNMLSCLMGNVEYAYELRDVAKVLLASEDSIFATDNTTVDLTAELNRQIAKPNPDARTIGKNLAIYGNAKYEESGYFTIAAVDLEKMGDLRRTVNVLSNALIAAMPSHTPEILAAYDGVPNLTHSGWLGFNRDLWAFCNQLQKVNDPAVRQAALSVKHTLKDVLIHSRDKEGAAANGLSICMPHREGLNDMWDKPFFKARLNSQFEQATSWNKFLTAIKKHALPAPAKN